MDSRLFKRILHQCLNITDEEVLILGDTGIGKNTAAARLSKLYAQACEEEGIKHKIYLQSAKTRGESADKTLIKHVQALPKKSVAIINMSNRIGRMEPLNHSFRNYMRKFEHRFISASSLGTISSRQFPALIKAMDTDYDKAVKDAKRVKKILDNGSEATLTSKAGTNLTYGIGPMQAIASTGVYKEPGTGGNLPGSEVYIAPHKKKVNGVAVIDGSSRVKETTNLVTSEEGIRMNVEEGSIVSMNDSWEAKALERTLRWAHKRSEHPWGIRRIGELGLGLNAQAKIIGATILDEKVRGSAHLAIGSNKWFGGSIAALIHLDQVMRDAKLKVDGRTVRV